MIHTAIVCPGLLVSPKIGREKEHDLPTYIIGYEIFYMNIPFRRLKQVVLKMCGIKNIKRTRRFKLATAFNNQRIHLP